MFKTVAAILGLSLLVGLFASSASAQSTVVLKSMSKVRGLECLGKTGISGSPASPIAGKLGASSALVDLNADGFDDLVVGAPALPVNPNSGVLDDAGHVYVLFGSAASGTQAGNETFNFGSFSAGKAIDFFGEPGDRAGSSIAAAGDVNLDGAQDVIIGTPNRTLNGKTSAGGAYIIFGRSDFAALPTSVSLSALAAGVADRAVFIQGARAFGASGTSVGGGVDVNSDGRDDVVLGAPLDTTNGFSQNGTATVLYGQTGFPALTTLDLDTQGAGQVTVVHGTADFQFMGFSVAGIGRFDPVLPMTADQTSLFLGDDVAIGAPGTTFGPKFFAGAVYVLRGTASGTPAASYTANDFGNGTFKAGVVYNGNVAGDQAGASVGAAGDMIFDGQGYDDFLITAPFSDGIGRPDCGSVYLIGGNFLGVNPQGFDLGQVGFGNPAIIGIHIQGAATNDGTLGVQAGNAGDWNGDNLPDLLVGFPNATVVMNANVYVAAGRARILNGAVVLVSAGTVDLSANAPGVELLQCQGEVTGAHVGTGLATGDFNGDGLTDASVGADRAPSDQDATGIGHLLTGRAHVVYGPVLRVISISPTQSHFGGPEITVAAEGVPDGPLQVLVDGKNAAISSVVPGDVGSISFAPPKPVVPGNLADIAFNSAAGDFTLPNTLQYSLLSVASGPSPTSGLPGTSITFTGQAFSTVADTTVTLRAGIETFPALVEAVDGLAGTMSVQLPVGPPLNTPLDIVIANSNGSVTLNAALQYLALVVGTPVPAQGLQTSGVFTAGTIPYEGQPVVPVSIVITSGSGTLPPDLVVEFGTAADGYRAAEITSIDGSTVNLNLPAFLLGPQDKTVDIRVTGGGDTGLNSGGFTYLASDFKEFAQYAQAGFGSTAPRTLMAGDFTTGGQVLLKLSDWPVQTQLPVLFIGVGIVEPAPVVKGGPFPINLGLPFFAFFFPGGIPGVSIAMDLPALDPAADGFPIYLHVLTREEQSGQVKFGFSNLLSATIDSVP